MSAISPGTVRSPGSGVTTTLVAACWAASAAIVVAAHVVVPFTDGERILTAIVVAVALVPLCCAVIVARRAPGNIAGPLIGAAGVALLADNASGEHAWPLPAGAWMLLYLPFAILLLVMPTGRAGGPWWRATGWAITAVTFAFTLVATLPAWSPEADRAVEPLGVALLVLFGLLLLACAIAPAVRYRRAGDEDRIRLRWILLAAMSLPTTLLVCWLSYLLIGTADLVVVGLVLMYLAIPVCATIALVRPDAVDVDRAVVTTIAATMLAGVMLGALSVAAAAVGMSLVQWFPAAAIGATAALALAGAAGFPALREALGRMLYPDRARALAALRRLTARVESGHAAPEDLQEVLRAALRDPALVVGVRRPADHALVDLDDRPVAEAAVTASVRVRGETIGGIVPSAPRRPPADVARAAGPLIDAIRWRASLTQVNAELEASRARILHAGDEQRRRLERDLHDGAQQRLVALGMRLRVIQRQADTGPAIATALDSAVAELGTAVAELRRLAHGLRPAALGDGLHAALSELVGGIDASIELDVSAQDVSDAAALTAYYVVGESVTNALRHAEASRITITVRSDGAMLTVTVDDDGRGGAGLVPTGGLAGLGDRVVALGGRLLVHSPAGAGTRVEAVVPCGS